MGKAGADAALVINPHYYKKGMQNADITYKFFIEVADASPIPIVLYNMTANTGIPIPVNTIVKLSKHPNIIGLKDSGGKIARFGEILHKAPDFQILAGSASFLAPTIALGGVGGVCALANIAPQQLLDMITLIKVGSFAAAT
eukprot:UN11259